MDTIPVMRIGNIDDMHDDNRMGPGHLHSMDEWWKSSRREQKLRARLDAIGLIGPPPVVQMKDRPAKKSRSRSRILD